MRHSNPRCVRSPALAKSSTSGDDVKAALSTWPGSQPHDCDIAGILSEAILARQSAGARTRTAQNAQAKTSTSLAKSRSITKRERTPPASMSSFNNRRLG